MHWLAGTGLGYDMGMTLNKSFPVTGIYRTEKDYHLISAAGPAATIIEALTVFFIMRNNNARMAYPFLFSCFYLRLLATSVSFSKLNDEARISQFLGIGTYTLLLIVTAFLFALLYVISTKYRFTWKFNAINFGLILIFSSAIVLSDKYLNVRIL
jgi:hypothetical protein